MSLFNLPEEENKSRDREMEQEIERHRRETQNEYSNLPAQRTREKEGYKP